MRRIAICWSVCLGAAFAVGSVCRAQMPAYTQPAPVPPALTTAKTVFLSNAGGDSGLFPEPFFRSKEYFSGDPSRAYSEFYAELQSTRKFVLVPDPSQADLVVAISVMTGRSVDFVYLPSFRLVIYDARTHYILWTINRSIKPANLQRTANKNFDMALNATLHQFLRITGKEMAPAAANPYAAHRNH